jgi:hypothetical protein
VKLWPAPDVLRVTAASVTWATPNATTTSVPVEIGWAVSPHRWRTPSQSQASPPPPPPPLTAPDTCAHADPVQIITLPVSDSRMMKSFGTPDGRVLEVQR